MKCSAPGGWLVALIAALGAAASTSASSSSSTYDHSSLRGFQKTTVNKSTTAQSDCIIQVAALLQIPDAEPLDEDEVYDCEMDPVDVGGVHGLVRKLSLSSAQKQSFQNMLRDGRLVPGQSKLKLAGTGVQFDSREINFPAGLDIESLIKEGGRRHNPNNPSVKLPPTKKQGSENPHQSQQHLSPLRHHHSSSLLHNHRSLQYGPEFGSHINDKPILVVKVFDSENRARPESPAEISDDILGTINDPVNMRSQLRDCSMGKLNVIPGPIPDGKQAAPGVIEVTINVSLTNSDRYAVHNAVTEAAQSKLGYNLPQAYQQVMYVVEKCYVGCSYAAYAYVNSWMSVYQDEFYKMVGVQIHELGHNFGFAHSGGLDGRPYTDHTGLMGNPLYSDDVGRMCFNAAKTWQIGWYNDRKLLINPLTESKTLTVMVGVADYLTTQSSGEPVVLKLETLTDADYFVAFNRAIGVNEENDEADDELTIVQVENNNGEAYSQSYLREHLTVGQAYEIANFGGSGRSVYIQLEGIDKSNGAWRAQVGVVADSKPSMNPSHRPTNLPTSMPSPQLTNLPTSKPTPPPSPQPSNHPTSKPTTQPSPKPISPGPPGPTPCTGIMVSVQIRTDDYPKETYWWLTNTCSNAIVASVNAGGYDVDNKLYTHEHCLPSSAEYSFQIGDTYGDGNCCSYGNGYYKVMKDGDVLVSGGEFGMESVDVRFGSCQGPTRKPTSQPTSDPSVIVATYDPTLLVPKCSAIGSACTSDDEILRNRGKGESGAPNTLDSQCVDGDNGSYQTDESIEKVEVRVVGNGQLREGATVEILATVWAYSTPTDDKADFYYTADASSRNPEWIFLETIEPNIGGLVTLPGVQFTLDGGGTGGMQAVRVNFRWKGNQGGGQSGGSCSGGLYDDTDDLVFMVGPPQTAEGAPEGSSTEPEPRPNKELPQRRFSCGELDGQQCEVEPRCKWRANTRAKGGGNCMRSNNKPGRPDGRPNGRPGGRPNGPKRPSS